MTPAIRTAFILLGITGGVLGWMGAPSAPPMGARGSIPTHRTATLLAAIERDHYAVTNDTEEGYDGYVSGEEPTVLHVDLTLPPDRRDEVLVHEWAHLLLGHLYGDARSQADAEVEARTVTRMVTQQVGIGGTQQDMEQWFTLATYTQEGGTIGPERAARLPSIARHIADALTD